MVEEQSGLLIPSELLQLLWGRVHGRVHGCVLLTVLVHGLVKSVSQPTDVLTCF